MRNFTIGADPEMFVTRNGQFISAYNLIPGTKDRPFPVENGAVQVDGMAVEFNIHPCKDKIAFLHNIYSVMGSLKNMVEGELAIVPVAEFGKEYMSKQPRKALEMGCDPDYNGWTREQNAVPDGERTFRTAAGHVHIGWEDKDQEMGFFESAALACQMDFFLGLPSLFFDSDTKRRELYGKAGAFRDKPYGTEYRTLSNAWLLSPDLMEWVFHASVEGADRMFNKDEWLPSIHGESIEDVINLSNKDVAKALIEKYSIPVPKM